jgi:hypothetical protein
VHENEAISLVPEELRDVIRMRLRTMEQETGERISSNPRLQTLMQLLEEGSEGYFGYLKRRLKERWIALKEMGS